MKLKLNIIPTDLLEQYCTQVDDNVEEYFAELKDSQLSIDTFSFYTSVSAVFSSKIEGENIELDSYIKHKRFAAHFQADYTRKIDDLYDTYLFAQGNELSESNIMKAHAILTSHILQKARQGKLRTGNMFVITKDGNIEYIAAEPAKLRTEIERFLNDLKILLKAKLTFKEVLFFSSLVHLIFVKIHPFEDGNGRTSRLLEKWFLAQKLGPKAWLVQSEKNYYTHHNTYYNNIRQLGLEYEELDYSKVLPFLLMLPQSIVPA